jgi:hypothetical protein
MKHRIVGIVISTAPGLSLTQPCQRHSWARTWLGRALRTAALAAGQIRSLAPRGFRPALLLSAFVLTACCEEGSGVVVQETRRVPSFRRVVLDVPGTVRLTQAPTGPLKLRTDDNLIENIRTRVEDDDTLVIDTDDEDCFCVDPTELEVLVSSEEIESLVIDGSGDIDLVGALETDEIELAIDGSGSIAAEQVAADRVALEIDGSGEIDMVVDAASIRSSIDGSGSLRLAGTAAEHVISIDGSGDIDAAALATATTRLDIDGSGECTVAADDQLDVTIDGSGEVAYCGEPRVTESIDGSGAVRRATPARCE